MSDVISLELLQHLVSILFAALLAIIAFACANRAGYFKLQGITPPFIAPSDCMQLFILFMALQFLVFPLILSWAFHLSSVHGLYKQWLNLGAISGMLLILCIFFYFKRKTLRRFFTSLNPLHDIGIGILSWLIAFPSALLVSQILVLILSDFFGFELQDQSAVLHMKQSLENTELFFATLLFVVFVVPVFEEIIFRGFLQTTLRNYLPPLSAIAISSFFFALFHFSFSQGINNVNILSSLFILALFLGFIRERQGNLLPSIALHSTFNGISVAMIALTAN